MHGPYWWSFIQRILCPVKVTSLQSSEPTWKSFLSLDRTRCSISVPPVPKRSCTKRFTIPTTDFPVAGLPAMGSSIFSYVASTSVRTRDLLEMLPVSCHCVVLFLFPGSLTWLCWVQHVTASISSSGNHATATQGLVKDVPPASGGLIHAVCRFLKSPSNVWRMTCFWWQLTHYITVHIIGLSLKKKSFEINVEKIPSFAGCHAATHPKSGSCGSRWINL